MASGADQRIKVGIRVRKLTRKEKDQNKQLQWKYSDNQVWQIDPQTGKKAGNPYTFDYVFGMDSSTHNIFEDLVKPIVESSVKGFNGTIFAYGQTSSGKTYTMLGEKSEEGIIPLSVNHVFTTAEKNSDRGYFIRVSYMEIYNEKIHDLLEVQNNLKIHEDSSGTAYVALKEEVVDCPEKVLALMKKGEKTRRFGVTDINERSSRSHTIFRITIESRKQRPDLSTNEHLWDDAVIESHLNLIDLAGSERVFQTKATGDRFKEGCAINKSLFHLGKVISQLSEGSGQYVNFRDSKLTRILESSLGGNAHTAIICTVTPASVEETASTFSFASRAIRITNTPHLNEIVSDECLIRRHAALVKKLELELEKAKQDNDCESMKKELEQKEKIICRLKDWIKRDELQAHSPCLVPRSDRRKTWAASDLAASLQRVKSSQDLNPLNEEEFGSGSMLVDSPFFESEKASEFGRRGRSCSGLWNKENLPLQEVRLSLQSPIFEGNGKELKRGSHGGGKKRKSALGDILTADDLTFQLMEKDHKINNLEFLVGELKLKLDAATKEKKKKCDSEILFSDSKSCSNLKNETSNMLNSSVENAEITVKINIQSLEASLEKEKLKVESLEESLETERLKVESLEESLEKEKFKVESLEESLEKEKLKVELLESALKKQTIEVEQLVFKEKELLSKIEENEANALSEKRALLNAFENMLDKKDNNHEIDLLNKVESCKEIANNLKIKLHESDAVIHSLTSKQDELKSALKMEKLRSNKASKELKNVLECISSLTGDLARLTGKSDDMELVVNDEAKSIEEKGVFHSKVAIMDLNKVIEEMKSFYMKEILELIKQAEGLSVMTMGMGEEISTLKIHFGKLVVESNEIKAERNEFESLLNIEKENINSLQAQLQSSYEHGISLSQQVSELLETLKKTEAHLSFMTKSNLEAETDLLTYSSRINELEEELQASEVVIANLAESDEDNLVELQEVAKEKDKLKDQLVEAYENVKSLLAEVKNMSENSIPSESLDALKSDCLQLSSECESYKVQLNEMKGAYVELEERNRQILEEKSLLMKEKDVVLAEFEQMKIAHSRWSNELRDALQKAECELLSLGKEKEILALDLTTEKDKNECMRNNMDKVAGENESLLKELEGLRQACDNESGHLEVISSLQKELDQIKFSISVCTESEKELDRLLALEKEKTQSLNNQLNKFDAEKEEMMLKCDQLQNLIYELKNIQRLGEEENAELENNISKLRSSNDKLTQKIHSLEVKCSDQEHCYASKEKHFECQMEEMKIELQKKVNEIENLSSKNSELFIMLDSKGETISELESHITMLNEKMNAYINEINAGKVTIIELQGDLNAAQDKLLSETANLREISEELMKEKLKEMLLALESAHEKLKVQNEEAAAEKENHEKIVSSLRSQLEEADEKFELILKQKEEKIISLVKEFEHEVEKLNCKVHETESLISTKSDVEARLEEVSAEKMKLQEQLELAEEKMENLRNDVAAELGNEKSSYEQNIASLQKQLQDTTDEFELILKEREGEISALEHELQQEVEKLSVKVQETEALISTKSDVEARLEEVSAEKMKLQEQLELSEEKMQNLRNDVAAELGTEKSSYEQNIASLQKQLQDTTDEFELILKQKEEKISALEYELQQEVEKLSVKVQETEALISTKSDVEARLEDVSAEKMKLQEQLELAEEKMQNLRNDMAAELGTEKSSYEQNIASLREQLQDSTDVFELILKQKEEKISALEHELHQEVEKLSVKVQETEALISTKSDVEARLEEVSAEKMKLQEQLELAEEKMQNLRNDVAAELGTEKSSYEQNIASLQKQLQDTTDEFELILKQKEEKISALEHELQQEVEKLSVKVQETEALISTKSDVEARLEEVSAEKVKLQEQLELSEEKMQNLRNDMAAELGTEKSSYEQNIASLQKQLQDTTDEFELILKQKEEKISALEHELQQEVEKLSVKVQETEALISTKSDVEARLEEVSAEKMKLQEQLELAEEKMQNLRNDVAAELGTEKSSYEQNIASLQKQLQDTTDEFELILKQKEEKISALEHELQQEVEKLSVKVQETEALISTKSDVEARLEEVSAEKVKLQEQLELSEEKMQNLRNDMAAELGTEKSSYEQNIASLQKQLQDTTDEFELILKQKEEKISALEHELQQEVEKLSVKVQETEALISTKSDVEARLEDVSAEKMKLQEELELAEEKMQNLRNDVEAELGTEKSSYEQNIASLQKQLQDAQEEFKLNLNQKDKIIASLESNINSEIMKYNDKIKECTHLECQKKELENQIEYFSQQEQKYLATERKLVTEEIRIEMLQKRLDELQVTYTASVDELNRLKCTEHDLQSDLEKIRKHNCELDNACKLAKTDLSSAQSDCAKLQSEVNVLKCKLQEESTNNQQLSVQLNIEQEGHLAARAAEEKILGVIASQDKIISVCENTMSDLKQKLKSESENCSDLRVKCQNLESKLIDIESAAHAELSQLKQENENLIEKLKGFHADHSQMPSEYLNALQAKDEQLKELENKMTEAVKERESLVMELARRHEECQTLEANLSQMKEQLIVLNGTISKNQEELNEFKEKYNERDEYSKRMDQWAVKMEKRLKITEDYRLEVQQKAKAVEADLRLKINELKTEKEGLEYQAMKPEPAKCNCLQFERDLKREKEEKEALRLKVDECNRMLSYGGKYESAHSKRLEMRESSVQTTTVEVVDIDPNGCGVVQICQVDYLNKLVNKLKKDKEDLKQICRRRHNQREDLKLEVNELKVKLKSLETQAHKS